VLAPPCVCNRFDRVTPPMHWTKQKKKHSISIVGSGFMFPGLCQCSRRLSKLKRMSFLQIPEFIENPRKNQEFSVVAQAQIVLKQCFF
jgi:hypothetical protein